MIVQVEQPECDRYYNSDLIVMHDTSTILQPRPYYFGFRVQRRKWHYEVINVSTDVLIEFANAILEKFKDEK